MEDDAIRQPEKPVGEPLRSRTSGSHRILVVEDEPCLRQFNTKSLAEAGYLVDAVEDGDAAWDTLQMNNYDLLVTDNQMPKVSGLELIKKVRAAGMNLPVIMATGTLPTEEFTRWPRLQPAATLLKPYTVAAFLRTVENVLRPVSNIVS